MDDSDGSFTGTKEGVIKVRDIRRYAQYDEKWHAVDFNEFVGAPWQPTPGKNSCNIQVSVSIPQINPQEETPHVPIRKKRERERSSGSGYIHETLPT